MGDNSIRQRRFFFTKQSGKVILLHANKRFLFLQTEIILNLTKVYVFDQSIYWVYVF